MSSCSTRVIAGGFALLLACVPASAQNQRTPSPAAPPAPAVVVPGEVALHSLMTLGDGYLQRFADSLRLAALTQEAQSAEWENVRIPLAMVATQNVNALVWFALPDGSYWSVQEGKSAGNLSDRAYFPVVLAGHTVLGALVVSRATGRASAIVAVPILRDCAVVGVLGASIYLDQLSERITEEMGISNDTIFYSFAYPYEGRPLLALEWNPQLIFVDPYDLGPDIRAVFDYMIARTEGAVRYRWADQWRTAIFRRSPVTGWWYVFGVAGGRSIGRLGE